MATDSLGPSASVLIVAVLLDAVLGDPRYSFHPIRLMGITLSFLERNLRKIHADGYAGGCLLFLALTVIWVLAPSYMLYELNRWNARAAFIAQVVLVYTLIALRDLFDHVWAVRRAARRGDLTEARAAIAMLVGRDADRMDLTACRRAAIESLSENFVDGFLSSIFWYVLLGTPGLLLFKVASTMDSMVGYKTPRYLRFGWCGARLDDVMNYVPARIAWVLLGISAIVIPGASARKGWRVGLEQHALVPGPNPGWSEATMAGVLQRRLIGPIWKDGIPITSLWLGIPSDPEAGADDDVRRAAAVVLIASAIAVGTAAAIV